jgi:uncharacterized protein (TIGR02285 family)
MIKSKLAVSTVCCLFWVLLASCIPSESPPDPSLTFNSLSPSPQQNFINLHYNERPPYLIGDGDRVHGLTADPANQAFSEANIPFKWQNTPSNRQLEILQNNKGRDCLVGWFKNPEREKFAKYTLPIYQDKPQIALAKADNDKIKTFTTIEKVLQNPALVLLVKEGYSYGAFIDSKIAILKPAIITTTVENSGMLEMLYRRRSDYFFIAPEEAASLIETVGYKPQDFKIIQFSDMVSGEKRYILCSYKVEDAVIEKLNIAIQKIVTAAPPL